MQTAEQYHLKELFKSLNNGEGFDHWSPSSGNLPFAKFIINYGYHSGKDRDQFLMNYKPRFGNLVILCFTKTKQ